MNRVVERFLNYIKYDTKSNEESMTCPSTKGQMDFGKCLKDELIKIGLKDVIQDENGYIYAKLPSNIECKVPTVGFIAHMDTSPDMDGACINPNIIENYDGGDIILNKEKNIVLSIKDFPDLLNYKGKTLITTDGTTLLGADDKAGVSEIVTAMEYLIEHPEIMHGEVKIAFTPDEEIGRGADKFNVSGFGADFAYTVDGGSLGELEYENFNACGFKLTINGRNVHPGSAKDKMINSSLIGIEFAKRLPENEVPSKTENYEGFYHLTSIKGDVEKTTLSYIIRDFDRESMKKRKEFLKGLIEDFKKRYGDIFEAEINDQYYNMREKIEEKIYVVNIAKEAMEKAEIKPLIVPIRGGTDGARLSFMGLPTPNLFTGGHNFHGKFEYIPTFAMEKAVELVLKIVDKVSKM